MPGTTDVEQHSKQYAIHCRDAATKPFFATPFPKPHLEWLSRFLSYENTTDHRDTTDGLEPQDSTFVEILYLDKHISDHPCSITVEAFRALSDSESVLLFLRGQPSSQWIRLLGAKYGIEHEFFSQHVIPHDEFFYDNEPLLMNHKSLRLRLSTLGSRGPKIACRKCSQKELARLRTVVADKLSESSDTFIRDPRSTRIRDIFVHDGEHFSVEQYISIYLHRTPTCWTGKQNIHPCDLY